MDSDNYIQAEEAEELGAEAGALARARSMGETHLPSDMNARDKDNRWPPATWPGPRSPAASATLGTTCSSISKLTQTKGKLIH